MSIPFKSSPVEFNQHLLFPSNIFDLLSKDHECYLYADLFQQIDTRSLENLYSVKGQNAYHPKLIVSILIYAYSRGVFSARQIEKRCNEDLSFMFIAQMNCPNFRVLSDFRKDHGDFFQDCFKQTVKLALELKLASLGHISLDGSKFKANTSKHKAMSYVRLKEKEQALCAEIDDLIEKATCPEGQVLKMIRESQDGKRVYQGSAQVCADCPLQSRCCQSEKGEARTITTDDKESLRQQMNTKMATEAAKVIYGKRKTIVEPVFGQIKNSGFRGFSVRGKEKVAGEFSMVCAAHNFKKIVKAIVTGLIRPEFGNFATNQAI